MLAAITITMRILSNLVSILDPITFLQKTLMAARLVALAAALGHAAAAKELVEKPSSFDFMMPDDVCIIRYPIYEKQDHGTLKSTS